MKTNSATKITALLLSFGALLAACESSPKKESGNEVQSQTASSAELNADSISNANLAAVAQQPQIDTSITKLGTERTGGLVANGAKLIAGSTCLGCHKENEKLVGPAYTAVAQKYPSNEANIAMLANKIIKGGKGNWGEIPMTPHPDIPVADAREMAQYILSLK